jgi:hypothetical protein
VGVLRFGVYWGRGGGEDPAVHHLLRIIYETALNSIRRKMTCRIGSTFNSISLGIQE